MLLIKYPLRVPEVRKFKKLKVITQQGITVDYLTTVHYVSFNNFRQKYSRQLISKYKLQYNRFILHFKNNTMDK